MLPPLVCSCPLAHLPSAHHGWGLWQGGQVSHVEAVAGLEACVLIRVCVFMPRVHGIIFSSKGEIVHELFAAFMAMAARVGPKQEARRCIWPFRHLPKCIPREAGWEAGERHFLHF